MAYKDMIEAYYNFNEKGAKVHMNQSTISKIENEHLKTPEAMNSWKQGPIYQNLVVDDAIPHSAMRIVKEIYLENVFEYTK